MELLKAIGLVPDKEKEKLEDVSHTAKNNSESGEWDVHQAHGVGSSSGPVPVTHKQSPAVLADGGPPLVDLSSEDSHQKRRRSTSTADVVRFSPPLFLSPDSMHFVLLIFTRESYTGLTCTSNDLFGEQFNKLEEVVFFWHANKTNQPDEQNEPYANTYVAVSPHTHCA
jgi:hypothetical protein